MIVSHNVGKYITVFPHFTPLKVHVIPKNLKYKGLANIYYVVFYHVWQQLLNKLLFAK